MRPFQALSADPLMIALTVILDPNSTPQVKKAK
jgi:hypothetical protein